MDHLAKSENIWTYSIRKVCRPKSSWLDLKSMTHFCICRYDIRWFCNIFWMDLLRESLRKDLQGKCSIPFLILSTCAGIRSTFISWELWLIASLKIVQCSTASSELSQYMAPPLLAFHAMWHMTSPAVPTTWKMASRSNKTCKRWSTWFQHEHTPHIYIEYGCYTIHVCKCWMVLKHLPAMCVGVIARSTIKVQRVQRR